MPDPNLRVLHELPHALLRGYTNELAFDQKPNPDGDGPTFDDPVKLRFGAFRPVDGRPGFYVAAISMDVLAGDDRDPTRLEKGFLALKMDPEPCLEVYMQKRADTVEDRDMVCVMRISASGLELDPKHTGGISLRGVRVEGRVDRMTSGDGRFVTVQQGDGNFVTYDTTRGPVGTAAAAVWASGVTV